MKEKKAVYTKTAFRLYQTLANPIIADVSQI